ncbi:hypothetical protein CC78DRAFT_531984 [Lojkania enalia]|uniref:Uncharacterized protein n=1 Tax=Lojkania enalia TaxID=147567 RepID=A0A9P4KG86_9PLEO|nr:hypothetical protein CC78DRAFT_531984 [Didymosphaeria enalia]
MSHLHRASQIPNYAVHITHSPSNAPTSSITKPIIAPITLTSPPSTPHHIYSPTTTQTQFSTSKATHTARRPTQD